MGINRERVRAPTKMNSIVSITIATLALANAASLPRSNGTTDPRTWVNVCDYSDYFGAKCCAPGMEGHQYLVVPENVGWTNNALQCELFGGWLTVLETREEWACIVDWLLAEYNPTSPVQRFAISRRADIPDYGQWAEGYPQGGNCVSLVMGNGVGPQGQWVDDCGSMWGF